VTPGIATTGGVGVGVDRTGWGARVAGGGGGSTGAGTKTSAGLAAGVTIRATVCFVEVQVGKKRSERAAPVRTAKPESFFMRLEISMDVPSKGTSRAKTSVNHILARRNCGPCLFEVSVDVQDEVHGPRRLPARHR
jgi:hypothetical protein